ncbi:hypothetical protein Trydic_g21161 [Trypoxylus dichotomus]
MTSRKRWRQRSTGNVFAKRETPGVVLARGEERVKREDGKKGKGVRYDDGKVETSSEIEIPRPLSKFSHARVCSHCRCRRRSLASP